MCPTVKMLATVREYCRTKVTVRGAEYRAMTLASRCQVVCIIPAATASSHFWLSVWGSSCPPYGKFGSPSRGLASDATPSPPSSAGVAPSSRDTFRSPPGMWKRLRLRPSPSPVVCGCFGGMMLLSLSRLRSSSSACFLSCLESRSCSDITNGGRTVALFPAPAKLGRRYRPANDCALPPGADVDGHDVEESESGSDSDSMASSGSSSMSRAREACAIGE